MNLLNIYKIQNISDFRKGSLLTQAYQNFHYFIHSIKDEKYFPKDETEISRESMIKFVGLFIRCKIKYTFRLHGNKTSKAVVFMMNCKSY